MKKTVLIALLVLLLVGMGARLAISAIQHFGDRPLANAEPVVFEVRRGSPFRSVVEGLEQLGVIDQAMLFRLYARNRKATSRIHAGEYQIEPGTSYAELLDMMLSGKVVYHQLTFVEGQRLSDFVAQLQQHEAITYDLKSTEYSALAQLLGVDQSNPEGWVYPDTYAFPRGMSASELLRKAHRKMEQVVADEWQRRSEQTPLKSPYEALILASIIEKETGVAGERPAIAGVFTRRLQKGMRLQTDPTVIYGMGEAYQGRIGRRDLRRASPYNTYRIRGLPPTPIASPGRAAIRAALNPAPGKALYFVAKGDGSHHFSATLDEHNRAVERYQRSGRRSDYRSAPPAGNEKE